MFPSRGRARVLPLAFHFLNSLPESSREREGEGEGGEASFQVLLPGLTFPLKAIPLNRVRLAETSRGAILPAVSMDGLHPGVIWIYEAPAR